MEVVPHPTKSRRSQLKLNWHPGQKRAWESEARFLLVSAGTRAGKTSFATWWLWREMKRRGPGDYLLCAPSYKLLDRAAVPYIKDAFQAKLGLGRVMGGSYGHFRVSKAGETKLFGGRQSKATRIVFGHADEPESLAAAQYKAAVCDEAGQKRFKLESWVEIRKRLAIDKGRCLFPTTPYTGFGWLKTEVYDRAKRVEDAKKKSLPWNQIDADYGVVNFESVMNPAFPLEEWERERGTLPAWKFDLFYRGLFTRPAGAVFDCWDSGEMVCPAFVVPEHWDRLAGIDFGYPNFATAFLAEETHLVEQEGQPPRYHKTGRFHVYREYRPQESRQANEHVRYMQYGETRLPEFAVGGSMSEQAWRDQFASHGYPISEPDQREVEVGIDRIYQLIAEGRLVVHDSCPKLISELETFSRVVGENGDVLDDLDDEPSYHGVASLRYIASWILRTGPAVDVFF